MPLPSLPTPRTWNNQNKIKATYLRQDAEDAIALLSQPPFFSGAQTISNQSIPSGAPPSTTPTGISLDTEFADPWSMHQIGSAHPDRCYPPFAGWYLCQAFTPLSATSGGGGTGAMIRAVQGGGTLTDFAGQNLINGSAYAAGPVAAKLVRISQLGFGTGDFFGPSMYQAATGSVNTQVNSQSFPRFNARWVCALTGTQPLIVPPVQPAPSPPGYVTSAWLNANIRDTISFLTYPPIGEWTVNGGGNTLASATTLPTVSAGLLPLDTTSVDNYGAMTLSLGVASWKAPVAGVYFVYVLLTIGSATTTAALAAGVTVTSANYFNGNPITLWNGAQAAWPIALGLNSAVFRRKLRLNAGDTLVPTCWQRDTASAAAPISGNPPLQSRVIIVWTGA